MEIRDKKFNLRYGEAFRLINASETLLTTYSAAGLFDVENLMIKCFISLDTSLSDGVQLFHFNSEFEIIIDNKSYADFDLYQSTTLIQHLKLHFLKELELLIEDNRIFLSISAQWNDIAIGKSLLEQMEFKAFEY